MNPTDPSNDYRSDASAATARSGQPGQPSDAQICDHTDTAARSEADVALARLLVEIRKVMFLPPTDPGRIAVMAEKRRVVALVQAVQARSS